MLLQDQILLRNQVGYYPKFVVLVDRHGHKEHQNEAHDEVKILLEERVVREFKSEGSGFLRMGSLH